MLGNRRCFRGGAGVTWWCSFTGQPWTWSWQAYPGAWLFVGASIGAYWFIVRRSGGDGSWAIFGTGLAAAWIALDWPIGALGAGYLLSVHQLQYVLLVMIAAPLILLGSPAGAFRTMLGRTYLRPLLTFVGKPLPAILLCNAIVVLTHFPAVVDGAMTSQIGSFLLDMAWLLAGFVLWWPVVQPVPEHQSLSYPARFVYLLVATLVPGLPSAFFFFARFPIYRTYELAPPMALATMDDQFIGGIVMKLGSFVIILIALSILFYRWHAADGGARQKLVIPEPTFGS